MKLDSSAEISASQVPSPVLAISVLSLSTEARTRLESSGCNRVLSRQANHKAGDPLSPQGIGISFLALGAEAQTTLGRFITSREDGNGSAS
jgi:hypothetical protein